MWFCPLLRPRVLPGWMIVTVAAQYVAMVVVAGVAAFLAVHAATRAKGAGKFPDGLIRFCGAAAWLAPFLVYFVQESEWAVWTAAAFAASASASIYRHHLDLTSGDLGLRPQEGQWRLTAMVAAALCLQLSVIWIVGEEPRRASLAMAACIALITWRRKSAAAAVLPSGRAVRSPLFRALAAASLAVLLTMGGLIPLAAMEGGSRNRQQAANRRSQASGSGERGFFRTARALLRAFLANRALQRGAQGERKGAAERLGERADSILKALAGADEVMAKSKASRTSDRNESSIAIGDSHPGIILRPETKDFVTLVPPMPSGRVFDRRGKARRSDPLTIPFFGAYWFFKVSDKTMPPNAVESRGNPDAVTFRTGDAAPMAMEARQNFGRLIDLSCCRAIEVLLNNADRRPNTVNLELILVNTRLEGSPYQSLGKAPVKSSLPWKVRAERPPVPETVTFPVPAKASIASFDEIVLRFELQPPRRSRSAKIAVDRLRLIPNQF